MIQQLIQLIYYFNHLEILIQLKVKARPGALEQTISLSATSVLHPSSSQTLNVIEVFIQQMMFSQDGSTSLSEARISRSILVSADGKLLLSFIKVIFFLAISLKESLYNVKHAVSVTNMAKYIGQKKIG